MQGVLNQYKGIDRNNLLLAASLELRQKEVKLMKDLENLDSDHKIVVQKIMEKLDFAIRFRRSRE